MGLNPGGAASESDSPTRLDLSIDSLLGLVGTSTTADTLPSPPTGRGPRGASLDEVVDLTGSPSTGTPRASSYGQVSPLFSGVPLDHEHLVARLTTVPRDSDAARAKAQREQRRQTWALSAATLTAPPSRRAGEPAKRRHSSTPDAPRPAKAAKLEAERPLPAKTAALPPLARATASAPATAVPPPPPASAPKIGDTDTTDDGGHGGGHSALADLESAVDPFGLDEFHDNTKKGGTPCVDCPLL